MFILLQLFALFAILGLALAAAASGNDNMRVYNGNSSNGKYSFVANIESIDPMYMGKNCTGALISDHLVLTTANCLMSGGHTWFNPQLMSVMFGKDKYKAHQALISDKYTQGSFAHNIGLIVLSSSVPSSVAQPVKIYLGNLNAPMDAFVAGYGITSDKMKYPDSAQIASMSILDKQKCLMYPQFDSTTEFCASGKSNLCMGDEGAPLLVSNPKAHLVALAGIASASLVDYSSIVTNFAADGIASESDDYSQAVLNVDGGAVEGPLTVINTESGSSKPAHCSITNPASLLIAFYILLAF
ncbi:trypsin-like cysteine/serine peptidase domain-containing protein [Coemansia mojavensis]|nr:trypsin-like cysteine/serine peptidase domain-containing protein [Coemansia mojavensis]